MYTYRGASFVSGIVKSIQDGTGCARGRIMTVTVTGYSLKEKSFKNYTLNFWAERKVYGKVRDMVTLLVKLNVKVGSHIIAKGIADAKNSCTINVDEVGYTGKSFRIENGLVSLVKVRGIYQTKNPEIIRMAVEMDGKSYTDKKIVWLTVKNIVNPMGFLLRYKDSVLKHVHTDDTLMVISSELKLYQGNGGDYLGGCLTGFYITKDFLSKKAE